MKIARFILLMMTLGTLSSQAQGVSGPYHSQDGNEIRTKGAKKTLKSIHPIEPVKNHYKSLKDYSIMERAEFQWMDTIVFPKEKYQNRSILMAMINPVYLNNDQTDHLADQMKFPANSSVQTRKELDFLLELQANRTPEEVKRVREIAAIGYWPDINYIASHPNYDSNLEHLFFEGREIMGDQCTAADYPETAKLLKGIMNDTRIMEFKVKYKLLRARPYQLETQLEPLQIMGSPSFASGHTLWAYTQAYIFSELIPEKRKEFIDLAYEIGLSREILGVHYPSDEEYARQLAHRMLLLMWHTETFQQDFKSAKSEWDKP